MMKKKALLFCIVFCLFFSVKAEDQQSGFMSFRWAVAYEDNNSGYQLFFQPLCPCYYYLIEFRGREEILQHLPEDFHLLRSRDTAYQKFILPREAQWFQKSGDSVHYLIVSAAPQDALEEALKEYFSSGPLVPGSNQKKRGVAGEKVLKVIRRLSVYSLLCDSKVVKPTFKWGVYRDSMQEQAAETIEFREIYVCKFTF